MHAAGRRQLLRNLRRHHRRLALRTMDPAVRRLLLHHLEDHGVDGVVLVLRVHLPELLAALLPQHLALRRAVGRRHRAALLPQQLAALGQHRQLRVGRLLRLLLLARALVQRRRRLRLAARVRGGRAHGESYEGEGNEHRLHGVSS